MVCLHGVTLARLKESLDLHQINQYPLWNWLVHKLTYFMYKKYGVFSDLFNDPDVGEGNGDDVPYIPSEWGEDHYSIWFWKIYVYLETRFNDVTAQRTMNCLCNVPEEEMANMIYDLAPLEIQFAFYASLQPYIHKHTELPEDEVKEKEVLVVGGQELAEKMANPADDIYIDSDYASGGAYGGGAYGGGDAYGDLPDWDDLPDLIPV